MNARPLQWVVSPSWRPWLARGSRSEFRGRIYLDTSDNLALVEASARVNHDLHGRGMTHAMTRRGTVRPSASAYHRRCFQLTRFRPVGCRMSVRSILAVRNPSVVIAVLKPEAALSEVDEPLHGTTFAAEWDGNACNRRVDFQEDSRRWTDDHGEDTRQEVVAAESWIPFVRDAKGNVEEGLWVVYCASASRVRMPLLVSTAARGARRTRLPRGSVLRLLVTGFSPSLFRPGVSSSGGSVLSIELTRGVACLGRSSSASIMIGIAITVSCSMLSIEILSLISRLPTGLRGRFALHPSRESKRLWPSGSTPRLTHWSSLDCDANRTPRGLACKIGELNWQHWEISRSVQSGNRLVAVKIDPGYASPPPLLRQGASWARSFRVDSIIAALRQL